MNKFYKNLINREDIKDIPIELVCRVVLCVFEIISSGDCFYKEDE